MKTKTFGVLLAVSLGFTSLNAVAQDPSITVGDDSGVPGAQVTVDLIWDTGNVTPTAIQWDIDYVNSVLTFDSCTINAPYSGYFVNSCGTLDADTIRFGVVDNPPAAVPSGTVATVTFTIDGGATPGTTSLDITNPVIQGSPTTTLNSGTISILGPDASFTPGPGTSIDLQAIMAVGTDSDTVNVANIGAAGSSLDYDCSITTNDNDGGGDVFSVTNGVGSLDDGTNADVTVQCDSTVVDTYTGEMTCTHNGDGTTHSSPATWPLSCVITPGPQPTYSSNPAGGTPINMSATYELDPIADQTVTISNSGDDGTTLTGSCSLVNDNTAISLSGGPFSVASGGATSVQTISCDSTTEGTYDDVLSCSHDGTNGTPVTYDVQCVVGPQRPAEFSASPAPGPIDITDGLDVIVGDAEPTLEITISNVAPAGSKDLIVSCSLDGGGTPMTYAPTLNNNPIVPQGSFPFLVSVQTDNAGNPLSDTLRCTYDQGDPGDQVDGVTLPEVVWDLTADVREAEADVQPSPPSGTQLVGILEPESTAILSVTFNELAGEGEFGTVDCSVGGPDFAILTTMPADIQSDGTLTVEVEGTDPGGDVSSIEDTLNCTITDGVAQADQTQVSYPLLLNIGGSGTFNVTKSFADGAEGEATVELSCNTGLPLQQQFTIDQDTPVNFVVGSFADGEMDCTVREISGEDDYVPTYISGGDSANTSDEDGCHFTAVSAGDENTCEITNEPGPFALTINKWWDTPNNEDAGGIATDYAIGVLCFGAYIDGGLNQSGIGLIMYEASGLFDQTFEAEITPLIAGEAFCVLIEESFDSRVEATSDCAVLPNSNVDSISDLEDFAIEITPGGEETCDIYNTIFFEGIPTLSQWGMLVMILLMSGAGMVGFRRFV